MAFSLLSSCCTYVIPLCLQSILHYLSHGDNPADKSSHGIILGAMDIYSVVWLMVVAWNIGAVANGQWLIIGRHISVHVNSALIVGIMNKSFVVNTGIATRNGLGKIMNLISVDIGVCLVLLYFTMV